MRAGVVVGLLAFSSLFLPSCGGHEADALSRAPAVTRVDVVARSVVSSFSTKASAAPGGSFDLGEIPTDEILAFEATGVDASGAAVVRGRSLTGLDLSGAQGSLPLFVQRTDGWARPPGDLGRAHVSGVDDVLRSA